MKKVIWVSLLALLIVLSACNSNEASKEQEPEDADNEQADDVEKDDPENAEDTDDAESDGEEDEDQAKTEEEDPDPKYKVSDTWNIVPLDEGTNEEVALITIDDAPDKNAVEMAKTLKELDVNAIFFVNGHFIESDEGQEKLKEIHDMGFLIGNHTYTHPFLPDLSDEEQEDEIIKVNDKVEEIIGERPKFFRAPNGANTEHTKQVVKDEGMTLMNWTYGYDWEPEYQSEEKIKDIMINSEYLGNGANLLMHDRDWTAAALADIVKGLRDKGYELVDPKLIKTE
jgi:peptidoglycan/xylan/chitin deacetylase (PgdA/CDA1 family)